MSSRSTLSQAAQKPPTPLAAVFAGVFDFSLLPSSPRTQVFTYSFTFWLFLSQVFENLSCSAALSRAKAAMAALGIACDLSPSNAAYCAARKRLPMKFVMGALAQAGQAIARTERAAWRWMGRRVRLVDATLIHVQESAKNRRAFGKAPSAKRGKAGYPACMIEGFLDLATGAVLAWRLGRGASSEKSLLAPLWGKVLEAGDVLVGDRYYCTYCLLARLSAAGVDLVARKSGRLSSGLRIVNSLGIDDCICTWTRARQSLAGLSQEEKDRLPEAMTVRKVTVRVQADGWRPETVEIITTLLDQAAYPPEAVAALYLRRWKIELAFRDLKATGHMGHVEALTPAMVRKSVAMHVLAHNLVRLLMAWAAQGIEAGPMGLSFKGARDRAVSWAPAMHAVALMGSASRREKVRQGMIKDVASCVVVQRPGRGEPRVIKRRAQKYPVLKTGRRMYKHILKNKNKNKGKNTNKGKGKAGPEAAKAA